MPNPSQSLATLRPDLGAAMEDFQLEADRGNFIGLRVLPAVEVMSQAGTFARIPAEQLLQNRETARAPGAGYSRGAWTFTPDNYACVEHGAEEPVDDREARMYANYFDAEVIAARRARDVVLRNYERRVAAAIMDTGRWTPTSADVDWTAAETATPIDDVAARVESIWQATGLWPNAIVVSRAMFRALRNAEQILERIRYVAGTLPGQVGVAQLAAAFDLEHVLVGGGAYNTGAEGDALSPASIWPDGLAAVCRIATTSDVREPCVGRTFHWSEDGSVIGARLESYRSEDVRADIIRARMDTDEKIILDAALELIDTTAGG